MAASEYRLSFICPLGSFFAMNKTRGALRTQSTTLITYLCYLVNYFLNNVLSEMFEWVLNTSPRTFLLPFLVVFSKTLLLEVTYVFRPVCI